MSDNFADVIDSEFYFTAGDGYAGAVSSLVEFNDLPQNERLINVPEKLDLMMFCVLILKDGSVVKGEHISRSFDDYDVIQAKKKAYEEAVSKINR